MKPCLVLFPLLTVLWGTTAAALELRDITYQTRDAGTVRFNHNRHIRHQGMANDCRVCHNSIYRMEKNPPATMADMAKGKSCGACHDGRRAFSLQACARCHRAGEVVYRVETTGPVPFSHRQHLKSTPDCGRCHPGLFAAGKNPPARMAEMAKGTSCGACHDGKSAFGLQACARCHPYKDRQYRLKGAGRVTFSHERHLKAESSCASCHPRTFSFGRKGKKPFSMAEMGRGKSCGACHDGTRAFSVKGSCARCHRVI